MSDSINLQLKQFSKAIDKSKLMQMQTTSKIPSELNTISQDLQEVFIPNTQIVSRFTADNFKVYKSQCI